MGFNLRRGITEERQKETAIESKFNPPNTTDLNNKTICITGTVPGMTRDEALRRLKVRFPKISFSDSITREVDYLLTGFGCGQTKLNKARSYNITIIDSTKFFS